MALIPIHEAQPQMELASDVVTDAGQCLLGSGAVIDEKIISMLERRGIAQIDVVAEEEPIEPIDAKQLKAIQEEAVAWLDERYALVKEDAGMERLRPLFMKWLVQRRAES